MPKRKTHKWRPLSLLLGATLLFATACAPQNGEGKPPSGSDKDPATPVPVEPSYDYASYSAQLACTDALGRSFSAADSYDDTKQVGLFYFLWAGQHGGANYDISKLSLDKIKNDSSTVDRFHYWEEPLYGYYDSGDPWVFLKHLELFTAAGVDYLLFDVTNSFPYDGVLDQLLPVALSCLQSGWKIPKFAFYCNAKSKDTVEHLYRNYYDPNTENGKKYAPLWYRHADANGANKEEKPWIAARTRSTGEEKKAQDFESCSREIIDFFYLKAAQWPNEETVFDDGMPWMSWTTESEGYRQYNHNGIMSVSVAQHVSGAFSDAVLMSDRTLGRGRGWTRASGKNDENGVLSGANFQDQWDYVFSQGDSVQNVFVTGWNEWVAQKQPPGGHRRTHFFVDLFNEEFSRDIEMSKKTDGYGDNYYLQLAQNIRRFKNYRPEAGGGFSRKSVSLTDRDSWKETAVYRDFSGDTAARDYKSANLNRIQNYTNTTGRNDIVEIRVAHDENNLYLSIECANGVTPRVGGDKTWMNVLFKTGSGSGYDFVVNRTPTADGKVRIDKISGEALEEAGEGELVTDGKFVRMRLPLVALSLNGSVLFEFKVCDHIADLNDVMSFYTDGDCAPIGRLNFGYREKTQE